jgi:hypothetical protein
MGENLIVGGLFVQLAFFGFFVIAAGIFQFRGRHYLSSLPPSLTWKKHLYVLYFTSILILIRSIFRVAEYLQGNAGYLLSSEVFLYIFDSLLMLGVMVAMNVVHPGDIAIMLKGTSKHASGDFVELESAGGRNQYTADTNAPMKGHAQPWS